MSRIGIGNGFSEELDVYLLGVNEPVEEYAARIIGIIHHQNNLEDKLVASPMGLSYTADEIAKSVHFQEQYYKSDIEVF